MIELGIDKMVAMKDIKVSLSTEFSSLPFSLIH